MLRKNDDELADDRTECGKDSEACDDDDDDIFKVGHKHQESKNHIESKSGRCREAWKMTKNQF